MTIYIFVLHFYDFSAFVGRSPLVSMRRIIYNLKNVQPFDCTASKLRLVGRFDTHKPLTTKVGWLLLFQLTVLRRSVIIKCNR